MESLQELGKGHGETQQLAVCMGWAGGREEASGILIAGARHPETGSGTKVVTALTHP